VAAFALPADEEGGEVEEAAGASVTLWETIRRWGAPLALVALALVLVMTVARRFGLTWRRIRFLVHKDKESEASYFGAFKRAARAGRPRAVARTFMFWLDRFHAEPGAATYAALSEQSPDPELDSQASALAADLYGRPGKGGSSKFTAARFFRAVARARKAAGRSRIAKHDEPALPFLNPVVRRRR
jgi:hypothetical protein